MQYVVRGTASKEKKLMTHMLNVRRVLDGGELVGSTVQVTVSSADVLQVIASPVRDYCKIYVQESSLGTYGEVGTPDNGIGIDKIGFYLLTEGYTLEVLQGKFALEQLDLFS